MHRQDSASSFSISAFIATCAASKLPSNAEPLMMASIPKKEAAVATRVDAWAECTLSAVSVSGETVADAGAHSLQHYASMSAACMA